MTKSLVQHASKHGLQSVSVAVGMMPHLLQCRTDTHLPTCDRDYSIQEIQIRELAINAIVDNMNRLETVIERIVNDQGAL